MNQYVVINLFIAFLEFSDHALAFFSNPYAFITAKSLTPLLLLQHGQLLFPHAPPRTSVPSNVHFYSYYSREYLSLLVLNQLTVLIGLNSGLVHQATGRWDSTNSILSYVRKIILLPPGFNCQIVKCLLVVMQILLFCTVE